VVDSKSQPGQLQGRPVGQQAHFSRLTQLDSTPEQTTDELPRLSGEGAHRIGEQGSILWVDPGRYVITVTDGGHREDVIEMTVGEQHRYRVEPMLA
jgi:hypothetical protein